MTFQRKCLKKSFNIKNYSNWIHKKFKKKSLEYIYHYKIIGKNLKNNQKSFSQKKREKKLAKKKSINQKN